VDVVDDDTSRRLGDEDIQTVFPGTEGRVAASLERDPDARDADDADTGDTDGRDSGDTDGTDSADTDGKDSSAGDTTDGIDAPIVDTDTTDS
jgi:hypothetical protein